MTRRTQKRSPLPAIAGVAVCAYWLPGAAAVCPPLRSALGVRDRLDGADGARRVRKLVCGMPGCQRRYVRRSWSRSREGRLRWSFVYLVARNLFALVVLFGRRRRSKEVEILVLRHELAVLTGRLLGRG